MARVAVVFQFWKATSPANSHWLLGNLAALTEVVSLRTGRLSSNCDQLPTGISQTQALRNTGVSSPKTDGTGPPL